MLYPYPVVPFPRPTWRTNTFPAGSPLRVNESNEKHNFREDSFFGASHRDPCPSGDSLEAGEARDAPELVAQGIRVLVLAPHEVEAGPPGGGEIHEDVGEGPHAGLFSAEWALLCRHVPDGELVVVAPADLAVELPEDGQVVDAVLLLETHDGLVEAADAALPDLVQELLLALALGALPDGFELIHQLALG